MRLRYHVTRSALSVADDSTIGWTWRFLKPCRPATKFMASLLLLKSNGSRKNRL